MKTYRILTGLLLAAPMISSFAQTTMTIPDEKRRIEVIGTAERELVPDELYFNISLKEYFENEKTQKGKVTINVLEEQLKKAIKEAGLDEKALKISEVGGYQTSWNRKKNPATFLQSKRYELKVDSPAKLDAILSKVEPRGIQYANIGRTDISDREEIKKQLRVEALKNARETADYMVVALDQKLGKVLRIQDNEVGFEPVMYNTELYARKQSMDVEASGAMPESTVEYKSIKFTVRLSAAFEIE